MTRVENIVDRFDNQLFEICIKMTTTPGKMPNIKLLTLVSEISNGDTKPHLNYKKEEDITLHDTPLVPKVEPVAIPQGAPIVSFKYRPATHIRPVARRLEFDGKITMPKFPRSSDRSKGLRHFSTKVCEKVREKGVTNYNEVADELVQEYFESLPNPPSSQEQQIYDQKNIRRRVYDALNVLMAMNIISKEKKEIRWIGLPTSSLQECKRLEDEKARRAERIRDKREELYELMTQLVAVQSLIKRNREMERQGLLDPNLKLLPLPFLLVRTNSDSVVNVSISNDRTQWLFNFNRPFQLEPDVEFLKSLGLAHGLEKGSLHYADLVTVKSLLPPAFAEVMEEAFEETCTYKFNENSTPRNVNTTNTLSSANYRQPSFTGHANLNTVAQSVNKLQTQGIRLPRPMTSSPAIARYLPPTKLAVAPQCNDKEVVRPSASNMRSVVLPTKRVLFQ
ncbi:Transcription factor Dp-1 [Trichinella nativa]|uniref:Transcription factor Dp-1 n=1 Tax=Trichinella nativa TaxID=6335 RepID=A0A0V1L544_9BILA|nr:Transcription factor Dp-1 [Trichinella nativa]KRZ87729.1 Transcription factor Dp-1 [Trichinella sp. T8]